jgi:PST family polysaccharide transporter
MRIESQGRRIGSLRWPFAIDMAKGKRKWRSCHCLLTGITMAGNRRSVRSGALLGLAQTFEMLLPFVRNIAIAHLMAPREFALSLTLSTIVAIAELTTDIGTSQMALKFDLGDARGRGTLHAFTVLRATAIGGGIALLSVPLARLFGAPEAALAFALAGASLALKGFANLAIKQLGREFRFGAEAATIIISQSLWTIGVVGMCFVWPDHRAMVTGLLLYALTFVVASNVLSPVRFDIAWDRVRAEEVLRFGRPLIPNGIALAITSLGDRIVIGARLGLEALALYGPLTATAILPRGAALRYVNNLFLPAMVRTLERGESLKRPMDGWTAVISLMGVCFGLGFMSLAEPAIGLVFGFRYAPTPLLASLMGLLLACRILITYPVPLAVATGRTWFVTGSSAISALSLLPATAGLAIPHQSPEHGLAVFLATLLVVETIGAALIIARTRRAFPAETSGLIGVALTAAGLVYGIVLFCEFTGIDSWIGRLPFGMAGIMIAFLVYGPRLLRFLKEESA